MLLESKDIVLFQGDSITDCRRDRDMPDDLGKGYALMVAASLGRRYPGLELSFMNRGIGGNRVADLEARWLEDCIQLTPTVVSVYIGVNDTWRRYDRNDPTTEEEFEAGYRRLLEQTRINLGAKLVIVEPFLLPASEEQQRWREDLDPKIQIVRSLAREYKACYVPLDGLFAQAATTVPPSYWAPDGVHPSAAGHALIAKAWLEAIGH